MKWAIALTLQGGPTRAAAPAVVGEAHLGRALVGLSRHQPPLIAMLGQTGFNLPPGRAAACNTLERAAVKLPPLVRTRPTLAGGTGYQAEPERPADQRAMLEACSSGAAQQDGVGCSSAGHPPGAAPPQLLILPGSCCNIAAGSAAVGGTAAGTGVALPTNLSRCIIGCLEATVPEFAGSPPCRELLQCFSLLSMRTQHDV